VPSSLCIWYLFLRSEYPLVNFVLTRLQYLTYKAIFNAVGMTRRRRVFEYVRNLCRFAGFIKGKNKYVAMWIICLFQQIDSLTMRFDLKLYAVKFAVCAGSCTLYYTKSATLQVPGFVFTIENWLLKYYFIICLKTTIYYIPLS